MAIIAPSFLASDFLRLQEACTMVNNSEAEWFHLDVMDGVFVPNISFGLPVVEQVCKTTNKLCDVHLMIVEPAKFTVAFKKAGADLLTVHIEACPNLHSNLQQIKALGMMTGVAVNPHTPISMLTDILHEADVINLMSVNPGFGGQSFIPYTLHKIYELKQLILKRGLNTLIEIDGGVTFANAAEIIAAGADVLVAGSSVFNAKDPIAAIAALHNLPGGR